MDEDEQGPTTLIDTLTYINDNFADAKAVLITCMEGDGGNYQNITTEVMQSVAQGEKHLQDPNHYVTWILEKHNGLFPQKRKHLYTLLLYIPQTMQIQSQVDGELSTPLN